ncbi:MBL fold metallo-hydrolase [Altererythrobacter salegens]|uniref:MBL fold metallo-hydrolase n=1 Tax=Croceibacterium salegens TaxID=1737568 RepID=A0A6I4ST77_9SPHN|nr:MBL fold metallo-hydrolase [Croceibacterium salegens]MXO58558.1 MBL fold metallo-hydrolase [Croceibacterium salegens]
MLLRSLLPALALVFAGIHSFPVLAEEVVPSDRVTTGVHVRAEPTSHSTSLAILRPGNIAEVIGDVPGWYQVRLSDGEVGFVSKSWTIVLEGQSDAALLNGNGYLVHVIDVGTGLAVFVEGKDFALLYDAGSQDDLQSGDDNRVIAYIRAVHPDLQRIDHVILSHPHKDHLELMPEVFADYQIGDVWDSGRVNKTNGYCRFLQAVAAEPGVRYHDAIASNATRTVNFLGSKCTGPVTVKEAAQMTGAPVPLGAGAQMTMLYLDAANHPDPNENTVVVRLDLGSRKVLLAGDAEAGGRHSPTTPPENGSIEKKLTDCCAAALRSDVLVVGHHGSETSSREVFLDDVAASIYAVSSGPHPYQSVILPDQDVIDELTSRGKVLRTDVDDEACGLNPNKIGTDSDERPGGCNNIVISIAASGALGAEYNTLTD